MCAVTDGIVIVLMVICAWCDWKSRTIPVWILLLWSGWTPISLLLCRQETIGSMVAGFMIGTCLLMVSKLTRESIGYGDSWIIMVLGVHLGAKNLIWVLLIASSLVAVASLYQMWRRDWNRKGTLPFVPFLTIGVAGVMYL